MSVCAETGARFTRERIDLPPLQWLTTPKRLLRGRTPMDACRTSEGFRRVALLHELSLGLDADPAALKTMKAEPLIDGGTSKHATFGAANEALSGLYTATVVHEDERGTVQIYAAMIARCPIEVRRRLRSRLGPRLEDAAEVRLGFDPSEPLACAMVSDAMAAVLILAAEDPRSSIAIGLDFQVEQRFQN